jgi:hypothetical protein
MVPVIFDPDFFIGRVGVTSEEDLIHPSSRRWDITERRSPERLVSAG